MTDSHPSATDSSLGRPPTGLSGRLAHRDLLDLLQLLHRTHATGVVHLDQPQRIQIHLRGGNIRAAYQGELAGPAALTRAILTGIGPFRVGDLPDGVPRNIPQDTQFLLDSIAKVLNEVAPLKLPTPGPSEADYQEIGTQRIAAYAPPRPGTLIGPCRLGKEIGRGASSVVFVAHHQPLDIPVVVKVLLQQEQRSHHRSMTINEARLLARLNHPSIVRLYDFDDSAGHPYLIVEYIDGPGISAVLRDQGRLAPAEAIPLFTQITEALAYAWDTHGLVHGDLKPDNILLTANRGVAKLVDFGLARCRDVQLPDFPSDTVMGTPSYIAPEQVRSNGGSVMTLGTDLYSLGATFYHILAGRPPFVDEDPIQLMVRRLHEVPAPLQDLAPGIPKSLAEMVMGLLATDPARRLQSHDEVLDALQAAQIEVDAAANVIRRRTSFWRNVPSRLFGRDTGTTGR